MIRKSNDLSVKEIFLAACQQKDDQQREQFIREAVGNDDDLRRRIQRMLAAKENSKTSPLDAVCATAAQPPTIDSRAFQSDIDETRQIGPYKLLHRVGEGGMGEVFVAEQREPVQRNVAIKLIKRGMDSKEVLARFEAERQALAMMNHPNIARIIDAGQTDDGLPYFVMDLVRGIPITEYCDQHRLSLRERLELFQEVCHAVQHAHQKGLIHRDLKPSNILVELHDVRHVPKIIDFGVAKATNQRLTERTLYTHFAQMVGTPLYMSPEQAELSGLDVDTRSDVYSLGVVLYELLTGTTPFDRDSLSRVGFDEMRRIIREDEPPRPSHRASTLKAAAGSTLDGRGRFESKPNGKQLSGELDWIVMKSLEKDRTRRYESASSFAADIQRYLSNEPVHACPPSLRYRLKKVSRRYKGLLATVAAVFLALLAGTGIATWEAVQAEMAAAQAQEERAAAERNMKAAMDAVERLLANVSNPELANVAGLQETWASILKDAVEFYERFKADSGSSPEVDYRAAKVFLQFGHLMTLTKPNSEDVIRNYVRGVKLAEAIVLKEPKRNEFRELLALLHLGCADYYWMPLKMATEEYDAKTEMHFRSAEQQYANLVLENPGHQDYRKMQGACFARMAHFFHRRSPDDPRIEECIQRASELLPEDEHLSFKRLQIAGDRKLAIQYWQSEIALYRAKPDNYFASGLTRTHAGGHPLWWASLAAKALVEEFPEEAEWIWHEAIKSSYDDLKTFPSNRGQRQLYDGASWEYSKFLLQPERRAQAVRKLDALIQSNPAFHNLRAEVLENLGDTDVRLAQLTESIRQFPAVAEYYFVRAGILRSQGELDRALADYDQVVQLDKDFRRAYEQRGQLWLQLGQCEKAIDDFNRYITMRGEGLYIWKRRALAYFELGQYARALADLNRAVDQLPDDFSAITWIASQKVAACPDASFRTGVLQLADRTVELNEGSPDSRSARAALRISFGQFDRAREDLTTIIQQDASLFYPTYQAALLALKLDDQAEYQELSRKLVSTTDDGSEPIAKHFAAWTASLSPDALDDYERAIELAKAAVEQDPADLQFLTGLGAIHLRAGQYEQAMTWLNKALEAAATDKTSNAYAKFLLAMTQHRLERFDEAVQTLSEAIEVADTELNDPVNVPAWNRKLTIELLRDEATRLVQGSENPPNAISKP